MYDLHNVMERVGRIVAADQLLKVDVRGVQAYALPGRVVLPAIENYAWLGEHAARMLHGMLDHECGHASFTNFDVVGKIVEEKTPAFKALWNALEDGMIERLKGEQFKGCAQNLRQLHEWFWEHGGKGDDPVYEAIRTHEDLWLAFCLSANTVTTPYGGHPIETIEELRPEVGAMLRDVEAELSKVATSTTTEEIRDITQAIYDRFQEEAEKPEPDAGDDSEPSDSDDDAEEHEPGDKACDDSDDDAEESAEWEEDEGEDDAEEDRDDDRDSSDDDGADDDSDSDDDSESTGGAGKDADDGEEDETEEDADDSEAGSPPPVSFRDLERWTNLDGTPLNPSDAIDVRIRRVFEQPAYTQPYTVFSHDFDVVRDFSRDTHDGRHEGRRYEQLSQEARAASESLAIAFEAALRAKRDLRAVGGYDEGTPDPNLLGEYAVGSCPADQLYQQFVAEDSDDVAVGILIDCSGSMGNGPGSKSVLAKLTAMALNQALSTCQIAHEITGFTTYEDVYGNEWIDGSRPDHKAMAENLEKLREALREAEERGTDVHRFARCMRERHGRRMYQVPVYGVFKDFASSDARGLDNVMGVSHNLDGEAVLWQAQRLAERPEKRRVMFVLSDGMPEGSRDNAQGSRYLHEAVARVAKSGIEIYGIGMASTAVREFYPEHWVCNDMNDLGRLAMTAMTDVLLRSRTEREWVRVA